MQHFACRLTPASRNAYISVYSHRIFLKMSSQNAYMRIDDEDLVDDANSFWLATPKKPTEKKRTTFYDMSDIPHPDENSGEN